MKHYRHISFLRFAILALGLPCPACKDPYVSPYKSPATGYLVVDGYISGNSVTTFTLTRTIPLPGDSTLPTVDGATVQVEGSDNSTIPLAGQGNGMYSSIDTLNLNPQLQYRLRINAGSKTYLSDFVQMKPTPAIDSISWAENADNSIDVYANTHDPAANTRYYKWDYDQTYQYNSAEETDVYYDTDTTPPAIVPRTSQVYNCWLSGHSSDIVIGTSTKLAADVIYEQPVKLIPPDDIQSSVLYSIRVRQYSLTADGYNFLTLMQKNTESLGSIFDAQPSQLTGNIHSLTTPTEQVIGWVSAGTVQQQRIFIWRYQIRSNYAYSCPIRDTALALDSLQMAYLYGSNGGWTPMFMTRYGWVSNFTTCLVCSARGGTTIQPSFWPT
jgi:hypothetical protein